jgi:hypothetical protein
MSDGEGVDVAGCEDDDWADGDPVLDACALGELDADELGELVLDADALGELVLDDCALGELDADALGELVLDEKALDGPELGAPEARVWVLGAFEAAPWELDGACADGDCELDGACELAGNAESLDDWGAGDCNVWAACCLLCWPAGAGDVVGESVGFVFVMVPPGHLAVADRKAGGPAREPPDGRFVALTIQCSVGR